MSTTLFVLVVLQGANGLTFSPATPPQRSACSSTRGRTLLASRMTRASAPGQRSLSFRRAGSGQLARLPARTSVSDTSVRLRTVSPPLAGSWLCPSVVTSPALPQCRLRQRPHQRRNLWSLTRLRLCRWRLRQTQQASTPNPATYRSAASNIRRLPGLPGLNNGAPPSTKPSQSFADVSVGPTELQSKDRPTPLPPKVQTAQAPQRYVPKQYAQHPEPLKALIDVVMLPFDFLAYPGRRDW